MASSLFCIDIGDSFVKSIEGNVNNGKYEITSIGFGENNPQFFLNDSDQVIEDESTRIKKLIETCNIQNKNVNCILPDAYTYSQILEMPKLNERELISAIRYQADQFIPMPIDETNVDIEILQEIEKTNKLLVLMVAVPKTLVERIQSTIELSGLIPTTLENSLSANARFFATFGKSLPIKDAQILMVNMEINSTSLYVFDTNRQVLLQNHTFPIGFQLFSKEIQINTTLDPKKANEVLQTYLLNQSSSIPVEQIISPLLKEYVSEIKKFISLALERNKVMIPHIYFMNDSLKFRSLPDLVDKSISIPTEQIDISSVFVQNSPFTRFQKTMSMFISTIGGTIR